MKINKAIIYLSILILFSSFVSAIATGGTITTDGDHTVHTFTSGGTFGNIGTGISNISILVVGGGGGGGETNAGNGGGGGAGGLLYQSSFSISSQSYTVTIGTGGATATSSNGTPSIFDTLTAVGGGGGAYWDNNLAKVGGSGGGGGQSATSGAVGTAGQGNTGGDSVGNGYGGGGGGGAGAVGDNSYGANGHEGGDGGVGLAYSINGSSAYYAGGGGGSSHGTASAGQSDGGLGGGGKGQYSASIAGTAGTANTGGGGGAGGQNLAGGDGGSGIVIIRYLTSSTPTPTLNIISPEDNNISIIATQDFVYNITYYDDSLTCSLFMNVSGTWSGEGTNTTALINASNNTISNTLSSGNYIWNVNCSNGTFDYWGTANYTITLNITAPPIPAPTVLLYSPGNDSISNNLTQDFYFNASTEYTLTNISLYIDGEYNKSNITAITNNANSSFLDINLVEGHHNWSIQAADNNSNETMSLNFTLLIDVSSPIIDTNFVNNTFLFLINLTGQWNLTDNNLLHSLNVTLPNDGITIFNKTGINAASYIYNLSYDISNLTHGNHLLKVRVADGHTSLELGGEYLPSTGLFDSYIKYDFYDEGTITTKLKDSSLFDEWESIKEDDKYIQILEPSNAKENQVFIEESDLPIYILNHPSKYKSQWIVIGNHWKDYVLRGEEQSIVSIKRINLYKVEVTVSNIKNNPSRLEFASVGDLNIIERYYNFTTVNSTVTFDDVVIELTEQIIELNISTIDGTNAILTYNGSLKSSIKTSVGEYDIYTSTFLTPSISGSDLSTNISFYWNYNITFGPTIYGGNLTYNQTIEKLGLDNCSTYTTKVINITILRSDTETEENATLDGYFRLWEGVGSGNYSEFNLSWSGESNYAVCTLRNGTFSIYSQLEFNNDEFELTNYYLANATISNVTSYLDLYFVPNATSVTFSVTDQDDNTVEDVYISILKYSFPTNSYITTQVIKTDSFGEAAGNIILNSQWYKFMLVYDGIIKLETDPVKIASDSRNFRIDLLTDFFELYETLDAVSTNLIFTNSTRNFAYTFLNTEGTRVTACLDVIERTTIADVAINSSCVDSAGGTILLNIGSAAETVGRTYIATGSIKVNPTWITDIKIASFEDGYKKYGKDGIFLSFLVRLTLALMGIWNPIVAIILLVLADIGMVAMGLYHLEWPTMIVYIILAGITMWRVNKN